MKYYLAPLFFLLFTSILTGQETFRGLWPNNIPFPEGVRRYKSSTYSQSLYKGGILRDTNVYRFGDDARIDKVHRSLLDEKWHAPGGLTKISGWKSDLYKYTPNAVKSRSDVWVTHSNGKTGQYEKGIVRVYGDGTLFVDVLSYEGKIFEVRAREKSEGKWDSYIMYKNVNNRPPQYIPVRNCASCHNEAGTGSYGVGLVPGSDTVISDPFDDFEPIIQSAPLFKLKLKLVKGNYGPFAI